MTSHPPKKQRAQGKPGARYTRGLVCNVRMEEDAHEHTGEAEAARLSLRVGLRLIRALLGDRLSCHHRLRDAARRLDASTGASGPHDFAVRFRTCSSLTCYRRPPHLTATSVTIASRPSFG